ncbi:DNA-binding protein [Bacillus cereus]|uniref:helix-turn-helix domain-containing protein n=1 Tax=Bacillus cereus TaxID=1396 RepID=UPI000BECE51A|nr:helix-turn-helix domain-containing protein [Bacillus cereus]PEE34636.1 DNA-binding protein [Bacillus cereus]PET39214.1 DNA-binding protein [Bacillus cereus]PEV71998.1 DNA-binding protein [Bacillus cereus]PFA55787.1 DNA-binding protein [Bacillus cereus]PFD79682.1 DNA-binding protein [Bacillus cereus]
MYKFKDDEELSKFIAEEIVNTSEAIEILGCTRQNIAYLVTNGRIKPIKEMSRERLFFKKDILKWKELNSN